VYSPRIDTFDLAIAPRPPFELGRPRKPAGDGTETILGWLGLPGRALGGMNARTRGPALWTDAYAFAPKLDAMSEVPIQAWSTKSFTARWLATAPSTISANLTLVDDVPTGTVKNTLGVPLSDCLLAFGTWAYRLGDLPPGGTFTLSVDAPRSELKTVLTGRRYVQEDKSLRQRITPYDRASVDPDYIVGAMLFHKAAGGTRYTNLSNAYQPFIDMSSLLTTDRAILVARVEQDGEPWRAANVLRRGEPIAGPDDRSVSIYRFVIPVEATRDRAGNKPGM
jgi:hypothetical protein